LIGIMGLRHIDLALLYRRRSLILTILTLRCDARDEALRPQKARGAQELSHALREIHELLIGLTGLRATLAILISLIAVTGGISSPVVGLLTVSAVMPSAVVLFPPIVSTAAKTATLGSLLVTPRLTREMSTCLLPVLYVPNVLILISATTVPSTAAPAAETAATPPARRGGTPDIIAECRVVTALRRVVGIFARVTVRRIRALLSRVILAHTLKTTTVALEGRYTAIDRH
jgi:hypothetical protein